LEKSSEHAALNAFDTSNFREKARGLKDSQNKKCEGISDEKMREERKKSFADNLQIKGRV